MCIRDSSIKYSKVSVSAERIVLLSAPKGELKHFGVLTSSYFHAWSLVLSDLKNREKKVWFDN